MFEFDYFPTGPSFSIVGLDEVGRGPLAGPVVAVAVKVCGTKKNISALISSWKDLGVTDSKKLSAVKRKAIIDSQITNWKKLKSSTYLKQDLLSGVMLEISIQEVSVKRIDKINIFHASLEAMDKSFNSLSVSEGPLIALVDGKFLPPNIKSNEEAFPIIKGDSKSVVIAMASIIAKEYRDNLMKKLGEKYPEYGLERHAGYPTKAHKEAIREFGPSLHHRRTFKGVKEYLDS